MTKKKETKGKGKVTKTKDTEERRTRNVGDLHLFQVDEETGNMLPFGMDYPKFTQTRDLDRWIQDTAESKEEPLPDGSYLMARVIKGIRIGSKQSRTYDEFSLIGANSTGEPEEKEETDDQETSKAPEEVDAPKGEFSPNQQSALLVETAQPPSE